METFVSIVLLAAAIYLALGLIFAISFVIKGVTRIDEGAHGAGWGFRILIIPGSAVFWPLLLRKWMASGNKKNKS